jgi:hypothetical protein
MGAVGADLHGQPDIVIDDQLGAHGMADAQHLGRLGPTQRARCHLVAVLDKRRAAVECRLDQCG